MELNQKGDSIECQASEVISRKFSKGYIKEHAKSGERMMFYKCTQNGTAEITKELNPKEPRINKNSTLDKGDYLNAKDFELWVDRKKRFKENEFELPHRSASHRARKLNIREFNYAKIAQRCDTIPERPRSIPSKHKK